jgi:hypothetical protein
MYKSTHTGLKNIKATAMTRGAYNEYRGWTLPANELGSDEGYLIEYEPRPGESSNLEEKGHVGYVSWAPQQVFDDAYHDVQGNLPFGLALELVKQGHSVSRPGWNTKICLFQPPKDSSDGLTYLYAQYMAVCDVTPTDLPITEWAPQQSDMLATDWHVVE